MDRQMRNDVSKHIKMAQDKLLELSQFYNKFDANRRKLNMELHKSEISNSAFVNKEFNLILVQMMNIEKDMHECENKIAANLSIAICMLSSEIKDNLSIMQVFQIRSNLSRISQIISHPMLQYMPKDGLAIAIAKGEQLIKEDTNPNFNSLRALFKRMREYISGIKSSSRI